MQPEVKFFRGGRLDQAQCGLGERNRGMIYLILLWMCKKENLKIQLIGSHALL